MENDLKFTGQNPVMINYNGSTDDIYAPVKSSSCDVDIVSDKILDDLYSANIDEICVKIEKGVHRTEWVVVFDDNGSIQSLRITPEVSDRNYTIYTKNLFYTDINGDFRFNGELKDSNDVITQENLKYNIPINKWIRNNDWNLELGDWYFHNDTDSYKIHWNGTNHTIQKKTAQGWDTAIPYVKESIDWEANTECGNCGYLGPIPENKECPYCHMSDQWIYEKTTTDCAYSTDNIIYFLDGSMELVWGKERYLWDATNMKWTETTPYMDVDQSGYFAIYGKWYNRIKWTNGNIIDTCVVNGVDSGDTSDWLAWMDPTNNEFNKIIPLENGWDYDSLFTDDDGYLYYMRNDGVLLYWDLELEQWIAWATFTETDVTPMSFYVDYIIPGEQKKVAVKYSDSNLDIHTFYLYDFEHPTVHLEERILPEIDYTTIWEGYKVPNTYSQDVTLNLDEILLTAIDPVSIMKYLKIDRLFEKPKVVTYAEFFGKAISYVMLHSAQVKVENTVSYGGQYDYTNGILDLSFQVSDFWDEMGEPSTVYEVIEELLRPFCMTFCYDDDTFQIFDRNRTQGVRTFQLFTCIPEGLLMPSGSAAEATVIDDAWKDNNIENPVIEIGTTYSKVTGVASTQVPEYSTMAIDKVSYNNKDLYDYDGFNVQRNKSKGYEKSSRSAQPQLNTKDYWFYLWNGVYVNPEYDLESINDLVNWYLNINGGHKYLTGETGNPNDYGSILNFYGGANNPTGTGKEELVEKPVDVKSRITAYAIDNGVPPEFLESTDINWSFDNTDYEHTNPRLTKSDTSDSKWGQAIGLPVSKVVYHQEYTNVVLKDTSVQTININLTQAYSRTGINVPINVMNNNTATNRYFYLHIQDEWQYFEPTIETADSCYFPYLWNVDNVKFNYLYFSRYATGHNFGCSEIWDRRRVKMYVKTSNRDLYQFNGKEWVLTEHTQSVPDPQPTNENSFFLLKLMNGELCFHTDFKYNVIETSDGEHYSLTGDRFTYYTDRYGNVVDQHTSGGTDYFCPRYDSEEYSWYQYINKVSEGSLSINLPFINEGAATITVDVHNSNLLGTTGMSSHMTGELTRFPVPFYYEVSGNGYYTYEGEREEVVLSPENVGDMYGRIMTLLTSICFIPVTVSYFKGEHLDLDISMSVPESNLGQMFSQSDIKYIADNRKSYQEEFEINPFRINTFNNLVLSSFSYLMYHNDIADPGNFVIKDISGRPEGYTVQAYMNWLGTIRKTYSKTLVPSVPRFSNTRLFITSSEVGENPLMVISDIWDLKSNRHSIKAIECQNLDVEYVGTTDAIEIPRRARNDLFNLPTAVKK